ncbi:HAD family hydrolase [Halostagnicola sp. A-GB9-2]|uniref:HAD family hydrolase n=1 Tax=Halostagnicola sp. A-GB9-2 TaxID=3048066 RepID=UPI0024C0A999|nr:HAD family hydrolase [Halostagnicola sp. A-GB9-2]MDJ1432135.1 HAD family hydrolase [Halostagnicola sp. A-GB9-2]
MKAIYFDVDGTLLHFTRAYDDLLADAFRTVEGEVRDEWLETYNERFYDVFSACEPNPSRNAFATVSENPEELLEELREREVEACQPPERVHAHLEALSEEFKLGVLTNGVRSWQLRKLEAYDLDAHFDAIVSSYDAGVHKPDPEPFALAERRLPADEYAMVGDSDDDIEGAAQVGWATHRYEEDGFGKLPEVFCWSSDLE